MTVSDDDALTWLLRLDVVRWSIAELATVRAHPFFLAYLHLRSRAVAQGDESDIQPRWNDLAPYLELPGGPPKKPYYRPLFDPPGNRSRYWLNENLAGSFAPSSLREGMAPLRVVSKAGHGFSLRPNHAELAFEHLLHRKRLPSLPFIAFLYRDFAISDRAEPQPTDLLDIFIEDWGFQGGQMRDFNTLFNKSNDYGSTDWFA